MKAMLLRVIKQQIGNSRKLIKEILMIRHSCSANNIEWETYINHTPLPTILNNPDRHRMNHMLARGFSLNFRSMTLSLYGALCCIGFHPIPEREGPREREKDNSALSTTCRPRNGPNGNTFETSFVRVGCLKLTDCIGRGKSVWKPLFSRRLQRRVHLFGVQEYCVLCVKSKRK